MIALGYVTCFGAGIWQLVIAFQEGLTEGLLWMFLPFYALYYLVTRWDTCRFAFLTNLGGVACILFGALLSITALDSIIEDEPGAQQDAEVPIDVSPEAEIGAFPYSKIRVRCGESGRIPDNTDVPGTQTDSAKRDPSGWHMKWKHKTVQLDVKQGPDLTDS